MSNKELTRRAISLAITALPIAAATAARASVAGAASTTSRNEQAAPPAQLARTAEASTLQKAQDKVRETSEKLRALDVAMTVEPAFTFRA
jgi:hypothetical protein